MKGRDEGNTRLLIIRYRCFQKLDELEKNGNCSYPVGGEGGTARCGAAGCSSTARRSVRDPFIYLFVNEGDETG